MWCMPSFVKNKPIFIYAKMSEYEYGMYEISQCQKILISISYGLCTMQYYHILHEIDNFPHPLRQKITSIVCLKACFFRARA